MPALSPFPLPSLPSACLRLPAATRADAYCRLPPEQGAQNVGMLHGGAGLQSVGRRSRSQTRMYVRREALPVEVRSRIERQIPQRPFDYGDMNGPLRRPRCSWRWRPGTRCPGRGAPTGPAFAVLCGSVASSFLSQRERDSSSPYIVPVVPGGWVPLQYCVA